MVSDSALALLMLAPSAVMYSTSARVSPAIFVRSALLPLAFVHRTASPSMESWLIRTPWVTPIIWASVSIAALLSAMARLACRWVFFRASRSACSALAASWYRNRARLLSAGSSPVL